MTSAGLGTGEQDQGRQKLEEGVWRQAAERAFFQWSEAPNAAKERYLLSGPGLAWVENNMIAHPEQYSAQFRRFVQKSVARGVDEMSTGRVKLDADDRRKETRVRLMFFAAAALAAIHASSGHLKPALEAMINGPEQLRMTAAKTRQPAASNPSAGVPPGSSPALDHRPGTVVMSTHRDPETGEPVIRTIGDTRPPKPAQQPNDTKTERERQLRLVHRAVTLAGSKAREGDQRTALLLAVEAMHQTERIVASRNRGDEPTGVPEALGALYQGLAIATPAALSPLRAPIAAPVGSCGGRRLTAGPDGVLQLIDIETGGAEPARLAAGGPRRLLAIDAGCTTVAAAAEDYAVTLHRLGRAVPDQRHPLVLHGHEADILAVAFSPDAAIVATASFDRSIRIWNAATGQRLATIAEHEGPVSGLRFGTDGRTLLSWSADKTARQWAVPSGRPLALLARPNGAVTDARYSHDGRQIATVSLGGDIGLWDATTGTLTEAIMPERSSFTLVRFTADDRHLLAATHDGDVEVWSLSPLKRLAARRIASASASEIAISPDNRWLLVTVADGSALLASMSLAENAVELTPDGATLNAAAISRDGRHAVALGADGTHHRWPLFASHADALKEGLRAAGKCLTASEREALGLVAAMPAWCPRDQASARP